MVLDILQIGNPLLRKTSTKIEPSKISSPEIIKLTQDLLETLRAQPIGVAISAVQVGKPVSLFIVELKETKARPDLAGSKPEYFFNAEIISSSKEETEMVEGCLSISHAKLFGSVKRPKKIKLKYLNELGETQEKDFDGFMARVIQHEVDHLNGKMFTDVVKQETLMDLEEYQK